MLPAESRLAGSPSGRLKIHWPPTPAIMFDSWEESGFRAVAGSYLERMPLDPGVRRDIDENGDLLIRRTGKVEVSKQKLLPRLGQPTWFNAATRGPRI